MPFCSNIWLISYSDYFSKSLKVYYMVFNKEVWLLLWNFTPLELGMFKIYLDIYCSHWLYLEISRLSFILGVLMCIFLIKIQSWLSLKNTTEGILRMLFSLISWYSTRSSLHDTTLFFFLCSTVAFSENCPHVSLTPTPQLLEKACSLVFKPCSFSLGS